MVLEYVQADDLKKLTTILVSIPEVEQRQDRRAIALVTRTLSEIIYDISQKISYAIKITPVRNTDYGHLARWFWPNRYGLSSSEDYEGKKLVMVCEAGANIFKGFKGSVPKTAPWARGRKDAVTVFTGIKAKRVENGDHPTEPTMKSIVSSDWAVSSLW